MNLNKITSIVITATSTSLIISVLSQGYWLLSIPLQDMIFLVLHILNNFESYPRYLAYDVVRFWVLFKLQIMLMTSKTKQAFDWVSLRPHIPINFYGDRSVQFSFNVLSELASLRSGHGLIHVSIAEACHLLCWVRWTHTELCLEPRVHLPLHFFFSISFPIIFPFSGIPTFSASARNMRQEEGFKPKRKHYYVP